MTKEWMYVGTLRAAFFTHGSVKLMFPRSTLRPYFNFVVSNNECKDTTSEMRCQVFAYYFLSVPYFFCKKIRLRRRFPTIPKPMLRHREGDAYFALSSLHPFTLSEV